MGISQAESPNMQPIQRLYETHELHFIQVLHVLP